MRKKPVAEQMRDRVGDRIPEHISLRDLYTVMTSTALLHGLTTPNRNDVRAMYHKNETRALPILVICDAGRLWVDKHYVAYQVGAGAIHYTYMSRHHINEELCAYREARRHRKTDIALPDDILHCFYTARVQMGKLGMLYWVDPRISATLNDCETLKSEQK